MRGGELEIRNLKFRITETAKACAGEFVGVGCWRLWLLQVIRGQISSHSKF